MSGAYQGYKTQIARRMFVATADDNYILARIAFFNELDWDFFWLGLHALEKYFKATLLMNDRSAKIGGHDLLSLYRQTLEIDPRMKLPELKDPKIEGLHWSSRTTEEFLKTLNTYGSAENRYNLNGYAVRPDHLVKLDQVLWAARRRCRRLNTMIRVTVDRTIPWDHLYVLEKNPTEWTLAPDLPLERLLGRPSDDPQRIAFEQLNVPFARQRDHSLEVWSSRAVNPPLSDWYRLLVSDSATVQTRTTSAEVLAWARDNIKLGKADIKAITAAIDAFEAEIAPPVPADTALVSKDSRGWRARWSMLWRRIFRSA